VFRKLGSRNRPPERRKRRGARSVAPPEPQLDLDLQG